MKKPESEIRSASLHAKLRPRFKKWADAMAREDDHSLAHWLEKTIQAEHERREAKSRSWQVRRAQSLYCAASVPSRQPICRKLRRRRNALRLLRPAYGAC
jgi:hypothetical protein